MENVLPVHEKLPKEPKKSCAVKDIKGHIYQDALQKWEFVNYDSGLQNILIEIWDVDKDNDHSDLM